MYHLLPIHSLTLMVPKMTGLICIHFKSIFIFFYLFYFIVPSCPSCCFRTLYQIFMCVYFLALTHFIILLHRAPHFLKTATFPQPYAHALPSLFTVTVWSCQTQVLFMGVLVSPSPYNILRENICFSFSQTNQPFLSWNCSKKNRPPRIWIFFIIQKFCYFSKQPPDL